MYKPAHFIEADREQAIAFMKANSFAVITGMGELFPVASHIPFTIEVMEDGKIFLSGHLMKNTDHHLAFKKNNHVLVIFNGPHSYVSASWYTHPKVASTWNYMTVHAKGKIIFTDDAGTYQAIKKITGQYEGTESVASFERLTEAYVMKMIKAIAGFSIEVESLDALFKLSQNHTGANRYSIAAHLHEIKDVNSQAIAKEMEKRQG